MTYTLAGTVDETMASTSDMLIIAMIVTYAAALFLFAIEAAYGKRTNLRAGKLMPVTVGSGKDAGAAGSGDDDLDIDVNVRTTEGEAQASQSNLGRVALGVTTLGFVMGVAQIVTRGLAAGRWPWGNMFEFIVALCLVAVGGLLYASFRYQARFLGAFVLVPVLLLLGIGVKWLYVDPGPLIPALHSYWVPIHVTATIIAGGAFMVSGVAGVTYLVSHRAEARRALGQKVAGIAGRLPSPELLDRISHRFILFAFPLWTFGIIAGSIWADEAWGRFWGWDPKEVWSFISWVIYAAYLHARATGGWRGPKATWINVLGFLTILFNFFAVNYMFSGLHSYA
ncbi:c-type cytochrome biogenesis protein CcsB [Streptomonospora nanhaiensis]|uniref:C-type cytochrome biogenesis protein CcsB n=1 Tax=Streptomonospora nanhaiensis TaxID=1323731 RepID=A0ABY6YLR0_9ACTN|nr:c-type cytochrome biogenesis protein CcsB [Streptomonospora nanhaiensis]WAE73042.1 c-type cytochrome biogenesis protein CcsB [Streptomonospora nanhaiensis]